MSAPLSAGNEKAIRRHPGRAVADRVENIRRDHQTGRGHDADAEQPEIPRHDEAGEFVEAEFRPLIKSAFQRQNAIEVNDDGSDRQIKTNDGEQPVSGLRRAEFRRRAHPRSADDKDNLRQNEIAQPEFLAKGRALRLDALFCRDEKIRSSR